TQPAEKLDMQIPELCSQRNPRSTGASRSPAKRCACWRGRRNDGMNWRGAGGERGNRGGRGPWGGFLGGDPGGGVGGRGAGNGSVQTGSQRGCCALPLNHGRGPRAVCVCKVSGEKQAVGSERVARLTVTVRSGVAELEFGSNVDDGFDQNRLAVSGVGVDE